MYREARPVDERDRIDERDFRVFPRGGKRERERTHEPLIFFVSRLTASGAPATLNSLGRFQDHPSPPMAASAASMRRSHTAIARHPAPSTGNERRCAAAPLAAASSFAGRRRLAKCAVGVFVAAAAGGSARGFGGASAAPAASSSKRAAATKGGSSGSDDSNAAKQLAETRAALREALDELAAMSAKAEVEQKKKSLFPGCQLLALLSGLLELFHPAASTQLDARVSREHATELKKYQRASSIERQRLLTTRTQSRRR